MKYIITESRLDDIFEKYMESIYGLEYNPIRKKVITKNGEVFGEVIKNRFYYANSSVERSIYQMFGDITNELLFNYLIRFPDMEISGVEWYGI